MRVLLIVSDSYSYGGTSSFLERLLRLHDNCDIKTALLVPAHHLNNSLTSLATSQRVEIFSASNMVRKNTSPFLTPLFDLLFLWRTVISWHPDLLVVSTGEPGRMSVALYFPVPVLYILHTVPERRFRFLPRFYLKIGSLLNNIIMTVSKAAAESIAITMGIPRNKILIIYNGCQSIQYINKSDLPFVITAGHLVLYKNPYVWLKVAQAVIQKRSDAVFVWLGDGELLETMRDMIKTLGLEERVLLPGFVSDISLWYERSQIYFQPSLRESHGIAVLEAMAYGIPCVVANTGGLPESVVDNETGFVCPHDDISGFSGRILDLLGDPVLRKVMGTAGKVRQETYFSEVEHGRRILALYEMLVKKHK